MKRSPLLGAESNNLRRLGQMRTVRRPRPLRGGAGQRFEPENTFWRELLKRFQ